MLPEGVSDEEIYQGATFMPLLSKVTGYSTEQLLNGIDGKKVVLKFTPMYEEAVRTYGDRGLAAGYTNVYVDRNTNETIYEVNLTQLADQDPVTLIHELMHVSRYMASKDRLSGFVGLKGYTGEAGAMWRSDVKPVTDDNGNVTGYQIGDKVFTNINDAYAVVDRNEEKFVDDFMRYLKFGEAPNKEVRTFFKALKEFIQSIKDMFEEILSPEAVKAFDNFLNGNAETRIQTINGEANATYFGTSENNVPIFRLLDEDDPTDKKLIDKFDEESRQRKTIFAYRTMQKREGLLYPPKATFKMAPTTTKTGKLVNRKALVEPIKIGAWYKSDESNVKDLYVKDDDGNLVKATTDDFVDGVDYYFRLIDGVATELKPRYNPYWHSTKSPLNDQFTTAYKNDYFVTVKVEIPSSDIESGYKAKGAKDSVGETTWKAGPVSQELEKLGRPRKVILSQYARVVEVLDDKDVANAIYDEFVSAGLIDDEGNLKSEYYNCRIPRNTLTKSMANALEETGHGDLIGPPQEGTMPNYNLLKQDPTEQMSEEMNQEMEDDLSYFSKGGTVRYGNKGAENVQRKANEERVNSTELEDGDSIRAEDREGLHGFAFESRSSHGGDWLSQNFNNYNEKTPKNDWATHRVNLGRSDYSDRFNARRFIAQLRSRKKSISDLNAILGKNYTGIVFYELNKTEEALKKFVFSLNRARELEKTGYLVDSKTVEDLMADNVRVFMSGDGLTGYAIEYNHNGVDGLNNLVAVFNTYYKETEDGEKIKTNGGGYSILADAIENGANVLDCYENHGLEHIYMRMGFVPTGTIDFSAEYLSDRAKEIFKANKDEMEVPVVAMYYSDKDINETMAKLKEGRVIRVEKYTAREVSHYPADDPDGYDHAMDERDFLAREHIFGDKDWYKVNPRNFRTSTLVGFKAKGTTPKERKAIGPNTNPVSVVKGHGISGWEDAFAQNGVEKTEEQRALVNLADDIAKSLSAGDGAILKKADNESSLEFLKRVANLGSRNIIGLLKSIADIGEIGGKVIERESFWYDTAHAFAVEMMSNYAVSIGQSAGIISVLSPQAPWDGNLHVAGMSLDILKNCNEKKPTDRMIKAQEVQIEKEINDVRNQIKLNEAFNAAFDSVGNEKSDEGKAIRDAITDYNTKHETNYYIANEFDYDEFVEESIDKRGRTVKRKKKRYNNTRIVLYKASAKAEQEASIVWDKLPDELKKSLRGIIKTYHAGVASNFQNKDLNPQKKKMGDLTYKRWVTAKFDENDEEEVIQYDPVDANIISLNKTFLNENFGNTMLKDMDNDLAAVFVFNAITQEYDREYLSRIVVGEGLVGRDVEGFDENHKPKYRKFQMPNGAVAKLRGVVSIYRDGRLENISEQLGGAAKVRSFYNNILYPESLRGEVTADTWAVRDVTLTTDPKRAAKFKTMVFGGDITKKDTSQFGTSFAAVVNEAFRIATVAYNKEHPRSPLVPHQLQSIVWTAMKPAWDYLTISDDDLRKLFGIDDSTAEAIGEKKSSKLTKKTLNDVNAAREKIESNKGLEDKEKDERLADLAKIEEYIIERNKITDLNDSIAEAWESLIESTNDTESAEPEKAILGIYDQVIKDKLKKYEEEQKSYTEESKQLRGETNEELTLGKRKENSPLFEGVEKQATYDEVGKLLKQSNERTQRAAQYMAENGNAMFNDDVVIKIDEDENYATIPTYHLLPETWNQILEKHKGDIRVALEMGEYIRDEYIEAFKTEEWAKNELEVRAFVRDGNNAGILKDAKKCATFEEFINMMTPKIEDLDVKDYYMSSAFLKRVFQLAHMQTAQTKDRQFVAEWTESEDKTLELAKILSKYVSTRKKMNGGVATMRRYWRVLRGISKKVLMLSDGKTTKNEDGGRSSSKEIREAQKIIQENPRIYRQALEMAQSFGQAPNQLDEIDEDISAEIERANSIYEMEESEGFPNIESEVRGDNSKTEHRVGNEKYDNLDREEQGIRSEGATTETKEEELQRKVKELEDTIAQKEKEVEKLEGTAMNLLGEKADMRNKINQLKQEILQAQFDKKKAEKAVKKLENWKKVKQEIEYMEKRIQSIRKLAHFNSATYDASFESAMNWIYVRFQKSSLKTIKETNLLEQEIKTLKQAIDALQDTQDDEKTRKISLMRQELIKKQNMLREARNPYPPAVLRQYFSDEMLEKIRTDDEGQGLSVEDLDEIYNKLALMRADAREMLAEKKDERIKRITSYSYALYRQILGGNVVAGEFDVEQLSKLRESIFDIPGVQFGKVKGALLSYKLYQAKLQRLARIIDGNKEGLFYDFFVRKNFECQTNELRGTNTRLALGDMKMKELGIKSGKLAKEGFKSTKGNGEEYSLTRGQMIGVYVYSKSKLGLEKLTDKEGNYIREADIDRIISELTPEELKWGDFLVEEMESNYARLSDTYYNVWNENLGKRPAYFPLVGTDAKAIESADADFLCGNVRDGKAYVDKGFTKEVNENAIYPLNLDVTATWGKQVRRQEHFMAYGAWARDSQLILNGKPGNANMLGLIERVYGKPYATEVSRIVNHVISNYITTNSDFDRTVLKYFSAKNSAALAGSLSTMLKQLGSIGAIAINEGDITKFFAGEDFFRNFLKAHEKLNAEWGDIGDVRDFIYANAPDLKNRSIDYEVLSYLGRNYSGAVASAIQKTTSTVMKYTTNLMDKMVVERLWLARYYTEFENQISQGKSEEDAHKEAVFKASQLISETQPTSMRMDQSGMQIEAKQNTMLRILSVFTNQAMNIANMVIYDIPGAFREGNWRKAIGTAVAIVVNVGFVALVSGRFIKKGDEDDDEYRLRLMRELIGTVASTFDPVIGGGILQGLVYPYNTGTYLEESTEIGTVLRKLFSTSDNEDKTVVEKLIESLGKIGSEAGQVMGIPVGNLKRPVNALIEHNPGLLINSTWGQIYASYE